MSAAAQVRLSPGTASLRFASALLVILMLPAAATAGGKHTLKVDALSRALPADPSTLSFRIHAHDPVCDESSLRFQEAARHIKTALSAHGLFEAPDDATADLIVQIDYGVVPCPTQYAKRVVPIYARGDQVRAAIPPPSAPASVPVFGRNPPGALDDGERFLGFGEIYVPVTVNEKFLSLTARENKPAAEGRGAPTLWRISASTEDSERNLRGNLPMLAAAVMTLIGRNTGGRTTVTVDDDDAAIDFIKKGP